MMDRSSFTIFFSGILVGVVSQYIPFAKAYESKVESTLLPLGKPNSSFHVSREHYSLAYDGRNKNPIWVYEHLRADNLIGETKRIGFSFKEDESLPPILRINSLDYKGHGFDRGHMAPAANHKITPEVMQDTFFMTNICPQCPEFNRGYWAKVEKYVRELTDSYENVYVTSGPIYMPKYDNDGKKYVTYQVISEKNIGVPTHFFKVIFKEDCQGNKTSEAFVLPNQNIDPNTPLEQFITTIEKIEHLAGLSFNKI